MQARRAWRDTEQALKQMAYLNVTDRSAAIGCITVLTVIIHPQKNYPCFFCAVGKGAKGLNAVGRAYCSCSCSGVAHRKTPAG